MELICEKYKQKTDSQGACCRYANEYCKFRTSCMIHFLSGETKKEQQRFKKTLFEEKDSCMVRLRFDKGQGLLPAIVQDHKTNEVLMMAYINEEAWQKTVETGKAHFWSRSRNQLWLKGESSQHYQLIKEILVDCDEDTVIYRVEQSGGAACHKGYCSCFFRRLEHDSLVVKDKPVFDPAEVYKK